MRLSFLKIAGISGAVASAGLLAWRWRYNRLQYQRKEGIKEFYRPSYNSPPPDWKGPVFKPSLDYPTMLPQKESYPWEKIDYKSEPEKYLQAVLKYCFEGNVDNDFDPKKNAVRKWFHAPWMTQTAFGREPIHGLTFERPAEKVTCPTLKQNAPIMGCWHVQRTR